MSHRCKRTDRGAASRTAARRRAFTLVELMCAIVIMLMVVGALGGLTRTVQQGFEYCDGYGITTQCARVILDRITQNVSQATTSAQFPGCIVVTTQVNTFTYPDTLVVWRPTGTPANPTGLPLYSELVIYCPHPTIPNQFVEMTAPTNSQTVPAATDQAGWLAALATLKTNANTKSIVLTTLLRACSTTATGTQNLRGDVRFTTRLRPSDTDWANFQASTVTWMNLPWVQGIYGSTAGLRQVWMRVEMQLMPGTTWTESNVAAAQPMPFFGSAALYYQLNHP
jgi:prepilin-type N-terminal cleavage/methylation domain-containing protein